MKFLLFLFIGIFLANLYIDAVNSGSIVAVFAVCAGIWLGSRPKKVDRR